MPKRYENFRGLRYWPTWVLLAVMRLSAYLPLALLVAIGSLGGELLHHLAWERRRVAAINLAIAFPGASRSERRRLERACFRNVAIGVLEFGLVWWGLKRVHRMTEIIGLEHIEAAHAAGRGTVLLAPHFTSIEVGLVLSFHIRQQVMYKRPHNALLDAVMAYHRGQHSEIIAGHHSPLAMIRGLKRGNAMWYLPDQDFGGKETVFVPFFGVEATALTAPARIAKMSDAPVLPVCVRRKPRGGGYVIEIDPPIENFPTGDDVRDALTINRVTEAIIRRNPEQYLWIHKRYKRRPDGRFGMYPPWE